jgi:hypothetical protein
MINVDPTLAQLAQLLVSFGSDIAASYVYEWFFQRRGKKIKPDQLAKDLAAELKCTPEAARSIITLLQSQKMITPMSELNGYIKVTAHNAQ